MAQLLAAIFMAATMILMAATMILMVGAWIQHFITSIAQELWVLLVLGAVIPPLGVLHGILVWLGVL